MKNQFFRLNCEIIEALVKNITIILYKNTWFFYYFYKDTYLMILSRKNRS